MDNARMAAILELADLYFVDGKARPLLKPGATFSEVQELFFGFTEYILGDLELAPMLAGEPYREKDRIYSLWHLELKARKKKSPSISEGLRGTSD